MKFCTPILTLIASSIVSARSINSYGFLEKREMSQACALDIQKYNICITTPNASNFKEACNDIYGKCINFYVNPKKFVTLCNDDKKVSDYLTPENMKIEKNTLMNMCKNLGYVYNTVTKTEIKTETKTEPKLNAKTETKTEPKSDAKIETKTESKSDAKTETKTEPEKSDETKTDESNNVNDSSTNISNTGATTPNVATTPNTLTTGTSNNTTANANPSSAIPANVQSSGGSTLKISTSLFVTIEIKMKFTTAVFAFIAVTVASTRSINSYEFFVKRDMSKDCALDINKFNHCLATPTADNLQEACNDIFGKCTDFFENPQKLVTHCGDNQEISDLLTPKKMEIQKNTQMNLCKELGYVSSTEVTAKTKTESKNESKSDAKNEATTETETKTNTNESTNDTVNTPSNNISNTGSPAPSVSTTNTITSNAVNNTTTNTNAANAQSSGGSTLKISTSLFVTIGLLLLSLY
ncbi:hypothetical protein PIROE2DRAFT_4662 [Piromyces sp. E2]|nr:hypothetical protein PIROE2DRAFT_4662 [Piromyces sp. E2]|eukprot:OUM67848.1 hypothetical protein PIROE2DRAFT_4662 [Piromyces sp. E2]